jgi:hypothetical protein
VKGVPRGGGGRGGSGPDRQTVLRPPAAGGCGWASYLVREQRWPGLPTVGAPATVMCGRVKPRLSHLKFKWFNSIQIFPNFDQLEKHIPLIKKLNKI